MDPMTLAAAPDPSLPVITHFIDGRPRASSRPLFENRDPTTGMVTSLVHEADAAAVDEAVSAARRALHGPWAGFTDRSEEHTSELQSLMRISYAVFCLKKKKRTT